MKLTQSDVKTESSGSISEKSFGIGDLSIIFDILRNKLYTNPVKAICREYSCNARDAHREAGKPDVPIEISLPNAFSPQYKIKDFGLGISPDRMENIFINYASSTKREDNIQTGAFGIGSKSAFSYTDTFTIITITNNTKRTYHAYIDESRVGKMSLASEEPTIEEAGTTIIIPVAKKDFNEFIAATIATTEFWDVKPKLLGAAPAYKSQKVLYSGAGWSLVSVGSYDYNYHNAYNKAYAIIDGIGYPIESDSISKLSNFHKSLLTNSFHFYFGNGELSLSASRDSIHYDEKTQKTIIDKVTILASEIIKIINDKIQNCESYKDACQLYSSTLREFSNPSSLETELRSTKLWKGYKLTLTPRAIDVGRWAKLTTYKRAYDGKIKPQYYHDNISYDDKVKIFHNDKSEETIDKKLINYLFSINSDLQQVQVISTPKEPMVFDYTNLVRQNKTPTVEYDMDFLKNIGAQPLSSIVIPKIKVPRKQRKVSLGKIFAYNLSSCNDKLHSVLTEIDNVGGIYIEVDLKTKEYKSGGFRIPTNIKLDTINEFVGQTICGFSDTRIKKLSPKWITLERAIADKIKALESEITEKDIIDNCNSSNWLFQYVFDDRFLAIKSLIDKVKSKESIFVKYFQDSQKVEETIIKYDSLIYILRMTKNITGPASRYNRYENSLNNELCKLQKSVQDRYQLLNLINCSSFYKNDELMKVINYINLVDESLEKEKSKIDLE